MIIRKYEDTDYERVRQIALSSFTLDSFHKDPFFKKEQSDRIIWEIWTKPAVTSGRNRCFVSEDDNQVTGFVLFGGMKEIGQLYGKKIGTLIILAVDEKFRKRPQKFGSRLVHFMVDFFKKAGSGIVTVGTDSDNTPALRCYSSAAFTPVLDWSTFRYYPGPSAVKIANQTVMEEIPDLSLVKNFFHRPVPFLADKRLDEDFRSKVRSLYISNLMDELETGGLLSLKIQNPVGTVGYVIFQYETAVSEITGQRVWRMNDVFSETSDRQYCIQGAIHHLITVKKASLIECFSATNDLGMNEDMEGSGFKRVHDAVTLHLLC